MFSCCSVVGQPEEYVNEAFQRNTDFTYKENIRGVKLVVNDDPLAYPILETGDRFVLTFDDLADDQEDYAYTIVHCDADWSESNLSPLEYIRGYTNNEIQDYEFSFNTLVPYTNYRIELPNSDIQWTKSGNYLLKIYVSGDEENLVITRRFMVVEKTMNISLDLVRPAAIKKFKTHHEIDFVVNHQGVQVRSPKTDVKVAVMQNGRWDNAVTDVEPLFIKGNELIYDYQDKFVFPAGREFRRFDARSTRYRADRIRSLEDDGRMNYMSVQPDVDRNGELDNFFADLNGAFCIDNLHEDDPDLEADYVEVFFEFPMEQPIDYGDIYVFGKMTDWQLKEEFKMDYSDRQKAYVGRAFLKQGYYNYVYAFVEDSSYDIDATKFEGNWWETDNDYHILVYYRPFGARYDQLVSSAWINSNYIRLTNRLKTLGLESKLRR